MKKNHSRYNLDKLLSKEDLELLKDKNRRSELVDRCLELVMEAKGGNDKSRDTLFFLMSSMIRFYMNAWFDINPEDFDEIMNQSYIIFVNFINKFDPEKGTNFISVFKKVLRRQFINIFKREYMIVKRNVINMGDLTEEEIDAVYSAVYNSIQDDYEIQDTKIKLEDAIKKEWMNNETDESIAEKFSIPQTIIEKIRRKLKYEFELEWGKISNLLFQE